ncbi:AAA family ATPase [Rubritalea tangerina]|uniref:AAA family ATPase n=1 Tax=Rubritalea tangerina TaxID=430798 RepID=UPI00361D14E8
MKTVCILSQKGGSGKTTLAINLAVASQLKGKSAMIADMDSQQSSSMWHTARADDFPYVQATDSKGLKQLHAAAEEQGFDHFFIDTAPTSNKDSLEAVEIADVIAVTCKPSIMDLRAISNTIDLIEMAKLKDKCKAFMVLSMVEHYSTRDREESEALLKELKMKVCPQWLGTRVAYRRSLIEGEGVQEYEPRAKPQKKSPLFTNS